ncbi:MAG: transcriptional repressor [Nitrospinae bacterium CG11_big_fil_rev_8_21_14_0_20_56_8]|nr:MAG: transcriptional repressor [Nitrospinae bacterium CG11_big_fil_rev_8_21_14_0_20_56_8]
MTIESEIFKDYLSQMKLRWTPQRQAILDLLLTQKGHFTAETLLPQVHSFLPELGIATVYRTLNLLVQCGLAREIHLNGKRHFEPLYRRGHHDHLVCIRCGAIFEFEHPLIEKLQLEISDQHRFTMQSHRMEILGICRTCREGKEPGG